METGKLDPKLIQGIIQALYRLFRVGEMHALGNEAIGLSIRATLNALRELDRFEDDGITFIFAEDTCIVSGQLLRAPPDVYESAMEFSTFLTQTGVNSITIENGVVATDLHKLLELFMDRENAASYVDDMGFLTPNIRLRLINPNLLLGLEDSRLSQLERILLTYALSVLVIRRLFSSISSGGFDLAGYFKRMARQLATVNYTDRPVVFDVIFAAHLKPDPAKLAVNTAILAVAMTRRFTDHDLTLSRVCMSALLLDVGKHRPGANHPPDQPAAVALSTAIIHMAMGSLRGDSVDRTIIAYEAQALVAGVPPDRFYPDQSHPSVDAHIISVARRFVLLVSWGTGNGPLGADDAVTWLHANAPSPLGHYCVDLLIDAIGLIPRGSCVELNSGFRGIVVRSGSTPSEYDKPVVRVIEDARGNRIQPADLDLTDESEVAKAHSPVMRVIGNPSPVLGLAQKEIAGPLFQWITGRSAYEAEVTTWLATDTHHRSQQANIDASRRSGAHNAPPATDDASGFHREASESGTGVHETVARVMPRSKAALEFERRRISAAADDFREVDSGIHRGATGSARLVAARGSGSGMHAVPPASASATHRTAGSGIHRAMASGAPPVARAVPRNSNSASGLHPVSQQQQQAARQRAAQQHAAQQHAAQQQAAQQHAAQQQAAQQQAAQQQAGYVPERTAMPRPFPRPPTKND